MAFGLKKYIPKTPSIRHRIQIDYKNLTKTKRFKKLVKGLRKKGGRNCLGRLTAFRKGGGHKKSYRFLSLFDLKKNLPFFIIDSIEYDPFRSAFINCCFFKEAGFFQYVLASHNSTEGQIFGSNYFFRSPYEGTPAYLKSARIGDFFYNVNLKKNINYNIACSAGTYSKIMKKEINDFYLKIVLPSGALYTVSCASLGFLGKTSNPNHRFTNIGKAGRSRWLGIRPSVRGVAMNPIDHPHGGGEGKSTAGRPSCTPWGFLTKGKPTQRKKLRQYFIRKLKEKKLKRQKQKPKKQ
jgi:large subunit ribosomal protein L2